MPKSFKFFFWYLLASLSSTIQPIFAVDSTWQGNTANLSWNDPGEWSSGVPGLSDTAVLQFNAATSSTPPLLQQANVELPNIDIDTADTVGINSNTDTSFQLVQNVNIVPTNVNATGITFEFANADFTNAGGFGFIIDYSTSTTDTVTTFNVRNLNLDAGSIVITGPGGANSCSLVVNVDTITNIAGSTIRIAEANLSIRADSLASMTTGSGIVLDSDDPGFNNVTITSSGADETVNAGISALGLEQGLITVNIGTGNTLTLDATTWSDTGGIDLISGSMKLTRATNYGGSVEINANGEMIFENATADSTILFDTTLTGNGGVNKTGAGIAVLTGSNIYSGTTTVTTGRLTLQDNAINTNSALSIPTNTSIALDLTTGTDTYGSAIAGPGTLVKLGAGALTLNSPSNTAVLSIEEGTLILDENAVPTSRNIDVASGATLQIDLPTSAVTIGGIVSGAGTINKENTNRLNLSGLNTHTGTINVNGGSLGLVGNALNGTSTLDIDTGLSVIFEPIDPSEYTGVITGAGNISLDTATTLTLSQANTYTGTTTLNAGALTLTDVAAAGSSNIVAGAQTVTFNPTDGARSYSGSLTGTGSLSKTGASDQTLTADLSGFTGPASVSVGKLILQDDAIASSFGVTVSTDATLGFNASIGVTQEFTGQINGASGNIEKNGTGSVILSAANTYGGTGTINAGSLTLKNTAISNHSATYSLANNTTLAFLSTSGSAAFSGVINDQTGQSGSVSVTMPVDSELTFSNANNYSGLTAINTGSLALQNAAIVSTSAFNPKTDTTLIFDVTDTARSCSAEITGAGDISKTGSQQLTLSGTNLLTGTISIDEGILILDDAAANTTASSISINTSSDRELQFSSDQGSLKTYAGSITGPGTLKKIGTATQILSGDLTGHLGTTSILEGTLILTNQGADYGQDVSISTGATLGTDITTATDRTLTGDISGAGTFTKEGTGTVELQGTLGYLGSTTIIEGKLKLTVAAVDSAATSRVIFTDANAVLEFGNINTSTAEFTPAIISDGKVTSTSTGTIILSGVNNYTGDTTISAGELIFKNSGINTSTNRVINNGRFYLNSTNGFNPTFSSPISGTGGLTIQGTDVITLTGANTYLGTTLVTGLLKINNVTALPANTSLGVSGSLDFNIAGSQTFTPDIQLSGTPTLTKTDTGTLTLSGANSFSSNTFTISAGNIAGTASSLETANFNINNSTSTLTLSAPTDATAQFTTQGSGKFSKTGAGTATIGTTLAHTGTSTVSAGTVNLTGTISNSALTISNGATLKGTGTAADINNSGTIAPGASIGTLRMVGDYIQAADGTFELELNQTTSDLLDVTGSATILGGTLSVLPEPGLYRTGTRYTFIQTTEGVSGSFDQIIDTNEFLSFTVSIDGNDYVAIVNESRVVVPVATSALRGNSKRVADYLFGNGFTPSSGSALDTIYDTLTFQPAGQYEYDLVKISPIIYSALPQVNLQNNLYMANAMQGSTFDYCPKVDRRHDRMQKRRAQNRERRRLENRGKYYTPFFTNSDFFIEPFYFFYNQQPSQGEFTNKGQPGFKANTYGSALGFEHTYENNLTIELAGGYTHTSIFWMEGLGHGRWNSYYLSPQVAWSFSRYSIGALVLANFNDYHIYRRVKFAGIEELANYRNQSYDGLVRLNAAALYPILPRLSLEFDGQLNFTSMILPANSEGEASVLNLSINKLNTLYLQPNLKTKLIYNLSNRKVCFVPSVYLGWLANIPLTNGVMISRFKDVSTNRQRFKTKGYHYVANQIVSGIEVHLKKGELLSWLANFEWSTFSKMQIYQGSLRLEYKF